MYIMPGDINPRNAIKRSHVKKRASSQKLEKMPHLGLFDELMGVVQILFRKKLSLIFHLLIFHHFSALSTRYLESFLGFEGWVA